MGYYAHADSATIENVFKTLMLKGCINRHECRNYMLDKPELWQNHCSADLNTHQATRSALINTCKNSSVQTLNNYKNALPADHFITIQKKWQPNCITWDKKWEGETRDTITIERAQTLNEQEGIQLYPKKNAACKKKCSSHCRYKVCPGLRCHRLYWGRPPKKVLHAMA